MPADKALPLRAAPVVPGRVTVTQVRTADGSKITIATFTGSVSYVLHNGSQDPGKLLAGAVTAGPRITGAGRARLLAAFNGGFMMKSLAGGYEQEGHVARPLRAGLASLVIDKSGRARIGVWGSGVPPRARTCTASGRTCGRWSAPACPRSRRRAGGGGAARSATCEYVARSALGENAAGDLIYAASMSTVPADLAQALAGAGATVAMELDINPEWVQLDVASRPGGPLRAGIPGQHRPANQYLTGWTRDFIAVLAPASAPG